MFRLRLEESKFKKCQVELGEMKEKYDLVPKPRETESLYSQIEKLEQKYQRLE